MRDALAREVYGASASLFEAMAPASTGSSGDMRANGLFVIA